MLLVSPSPKFQNLLVVTSVRLSLLNLTVRGLHPLTLPAGNKESGRVQSGNGSVPRVHVGNEVVRDTGSSDVVVVVVVVNSVWAEIELLLNAIATLKSNKVIKRDLTLK